MARRAHGHQTRSGLHFSCLAEKQRRLSALRAVLSTLVTIEACSSFLWRTNSLGKSELKLIMTRGRRIKGTYVYRRTEAKSGAAGLYICIFLICLSSIMARRDCFDLLLCYSRIKGLKCPGVSLSTLSIAVLLFWSKKNVKGVFLFYRYFFIFFERSKYLLLIFRILWGLGVKSHTSISFLALFHSSLFLTHREQKSFKMWFLSWRFWV